MLVPTAQRSRRSVTATHSVCDASQDTRTCIQTWVTHSVSYYASQDTRACIQTWITHSVYYHASQTQGNTVRRESHSISISGPCMHACFAFFAYGLNHHEYTMDVVHPSCHTSVTTLTIPCIMALSVSIPSVYESIATPAIALPRAAADMRTWDDVACRC